MTQGLNNNRNMQFDNCACEDYLGLFSRTDV